MADPKDSVNRMNVQGTSQTRVGSTELEKDAVAAADSAKQAAEAAKQKAGELGQQAKQAASGAVKDAKQQARGFADEQKDQAASQVDGVAQALRSAAGSLDDQDQSAVAGYARQAASGLDRVSDALSNRSLDDLVETVEDFAKRQPVAFIGGAALAGFVMARFAKSSAERRHAGGHRRDAGWEAIYARRSEGYNPGGMAPEDRTSHRFPDASNQEVK
jgi:hypothetical protein